MPPKASPDGEWLTISDFTPGCYSYSSVPGSKPIVPSKPGSADAGHTFSCIALPSGGLGALPGLAQTYTYTPTASLTTPNFIVGLLVHNELSNGNTEALLIVEYDNGTNHSWSVFSVIVETNTFTAVTDTFVASSPGFFGSPFPAMTRAAATNPTTTDGNPVIVWPAGGPAFMNANAGQLFMYPNPATPTSFTPLELITNGTPQSITGAVLVHQSRILLLAGIDYPYPQGGGFDTNEQINYTDPPNSVILPPLSTPGQQTVLVSEEPYGYGGGGSISAGELFLVKRRGGGVVVTGDIFAPSVTYLPGVQPTYGFYGNAASGQAGLYYGSLHNGIWVWNGGSTSQKVSGQLDDDFFLDPNYGQITSDAYGYYAQSVGDKVYFSHNWVFDTRTNSWWKYYPDETQGGVALWWIQPVKGPDLFAAPLSFVAANPTWLYRFSQTTSAQTYQWQSLPLKLAEHDHVVDVREVVITASCPNGGASITLSILDQGNVIWGPTAMTGTVGTGPEMIRFAAAAQGATEPAIRISVVGTLSEAMPTIHEIDFRYKTRAHQAVTD